MAKITELNRPENEYFKISFIQHEPALDMRFLMERNQTVNCFVMNEFVLIRSPTSKTQFWVEYVTSELTQKRTLKPTTTQKVMKQLTDKQKIEFIENWTFLKGKKPI